jgi:myosin heavy subunit
MSIEQIWVKNTDCNSTDLYTLSNNNNQTEFEYYSSKDNEQVENLINLTYINLPSIMHVLNKRYDLNDIYTYNGEILISINPFKSIDIYHQNIVANTEKPHIYSISEKAYRNANMQNQSILVSGESGSGKTENTKYMLKYLCDNYARDKDIASKIINSNYLIELFGNAKTIRNSNSSRFGKFIKLYLKNNTIIGGNIENYLLEKSRISFTNILEKTYHIFYLVCYHKDSLSKYNFKSIENYKLLINSKYKDQLEEFQNLDLLRDIFTQFEFDTKDQDKIFITLKLILELLNCDNIEDLKEVLDSEIDMLETIKLDKEDLLTKLTTKIYTVNGEKIVKQLDNDGVKVSIRTFCEDQYELNFNNIIEKVSVSLGDVSDKYISILDIFGFEVFESNGYEQLCINYTNEMLQQIFNQYVFKSEQQEYEKENLNWKHIDYVQNDSIVELFNGKISLFSIINEQTILGSGNDNNIYGQFEKHISKDLFNIENIKRHDNIFTIKHFTGEVDYTVDNYVLKNRISSENTKVKTNLQQFNNQLTQLKNELMVNNCYFVRCIKPNNDNVPDFFNQTKIYNQLLYSGIMEGIKIVLAGYPIKKLKDDINEEFKFYSYYNDNKSITDILDTDDTINENEYQIGNSKVFMKSKFYKDLYNKNKIYRDNIIVCLQKNVRRYICVRKYYFSLYYIRLIQSKIRQYHATRRVIRIRQIAKSCIINANARRFIQYRNYKKYKSVTLIAKHVRRLIQVNKYKTIIQKRISYAALTITFWFKRIVINKKISNRSVVNKLTLQLEDSRKDILKLKEELAETKKELDFKNSIIISKDIEIDSLKKEVLNMKSAVKNMSFINELSDYDENNGIKKNMEQLLTVNESESIDIIENYDQNEEIVNNTVNNDDESTLDIPIKTIKLKELYNIPLSSDSDSDLSLNKGDIEYIHSKKLEELGGKMEKLYLELQNKKQIIDFMRAKHSALQRAYESERLKKTNIWEVMQSYFSTK